MKFQDHWTRGQLSTSEKQLIVAVDHGLSFPNMPGLEQPLEIIRKVLTKPSVDGIIATPGMYRQAERHKIDLSGLNRLIALDCVKQEGTTIVQREVVFTPDEVMGYHPDCFKFFFNIYQDKAELMRNLKDIARIAKDARRLGVSSLAEIMFWNNDEYLDTSKQEDLLYQGCRMAMELGVDALKVSADVPPAAMNTIIDRIQLPTFILGGSRNIKSDGFFEDVAQMNKMNICGVMFGRNIWQSMDMDVTIDGIDSILKQWKPDQPV